MVKYKEEWDKKRIKNPISTYPDKVKISKNKHTANCYRKIRTVFRDKYIREKFDKPLYPKEKEFLQWIKFYLNDLEKKLR